MDNKTKLGLRIKEIRKRQGFSQEKLAELVSIEPTALSNIETGRNYPSFKTLEKILVVLKSSYSEMFSFSHHEKTENLVKEINKILEKYPDKVSDFYKIAKALVE